MRNTLPTPTGLARYRSALLAERARLMRGSGAHREMLAIPDSIAVEDHARLLHDQFVALGEHRIQMGKLKLIDAALNRLEAGEYGTCVECDGPIPAKRLAAIPWAACCVRCQEVLDERIGGATDEPLVMTA